MNFARVSCQLAIGLLLAISSFASSAQTPDASVTLHPDRPGPQYDRHIFGQFSEHLGSGIYGGIWVGKDSSIPNVEGYREDVLDALREIRVPVIRWPGGCFADEYHWRDGIGPAGARKVRINTNWGNVTEPNSFGTHEFMRFIELLGAEPYVAGNVGASSPSEMAEWVEYITSTTGSTLARERASNGHADPWKLPFLGIGNELWGCGGSMRPEYAADLTRRFATFVKIPASQKIMKIASGPNVDDYNWTDVMMRQAGGMIDGIALHYYTVAGGWGDKGSATQFDERRWAQTLARTWTMDELLTRHSAVMDRYDPGKRVWLVVDEWGNWYDVEPGTNPDFLYQQNSLRDAVSAAINLNIFARHADRVRMTSIAQMVNVLQSMLLTDGARMVRTPTYWVFDLYKPWQDAAVVPIDVRSKNYEYNGLSMPGISASAVKSQDGVIHVALVNVDPNVSRSVTVDLGGIKVSSVKGQAITAPHIQAFNSFEHPDNVRPEPFAGARIDGGTMQVVMPARSVVVLTLQ